MASTWQAQAANVFVRQGATGNGSGSNWTNAMTNIPATSSLVRGNVYYIADGSYSFPTPLNTANSGTQTIEFRKCSTTDGVSSGISGYSSTFCDGQAIFNNDAALDSDYWIFNGVYRNESSWSQASAYGFQISGFLTHSLQYTHAADNVTIKYVNIGPDDGNTNLQGYGGAVLYYGGFGQTADNWIIQRNYIHNGRAMGQHAGVHNLLYEYNWFAKNWEKTGFRGQIRASSVVFRYNVFRDVCLGNNFDPSATSCTAILGWYGNSGSNNEDYSNSAAYGNLFIDTIGTNFYSDAVIFMGDDRTSQGGGPQNCSGCKILNNTFVGIGKNSSSGAIGFKFTGITTNTEARNNIWYDIGSHTPFCQATACSNNPKITSAGVFLNAGVGNFHLSSNGAAGSGNTLSSPYNIDMDGLVRGGGGTWDIGAFEFGSGAPAPLPLPPPSNLRIVGN